jgi:hypothetical protein
MRQRRIDASKSYPILNQQPKYLWSVIGVKVVEC